jgi:hypothetical protein
MFGERSCLSLIVAGSSTNAELGGVSAGGAGTPELDVTHVVLDQPVGSVGGVTPSKNSVRNEKGLHGRSTQRFSPISAAAPILAGPSAEAEARNRQKRSLSRVSMNVRFVFVVTESDRLTFSGFFKTFSVVHLTAIRLHLANSGSIRRICLKGCMIASCLAHRQKKSGWKMVVTVNHESRKMYRWIGSPRRADGSGPNSTRWGQRVPPSCLPGFLIRNLTTEDPSVETLHLFSTE